MKEIFYQHNEQFENDVDPIFKYKNTTVYLSNYLEPRNIDNLKNNNIGYIINATRHLKNYHYDKDIKYLKVFIRDNDIYVRILKLALPKIFNFFEEAVDNNKNILIHCKRGHRRSATIVVILMNKYNNTNIEEAVKLIKSIRPNSFKPATTINKILNYI